MAQQKAVNHQAGDQSPPWRATSQATTGGPANWPSEDNCCTQPTVVATCCSPGAKRTAKLNKVPTRLRLKTDEVDLVIEAGRLATRASPEFNGFLASLEGNDVDARIQKGIAAGGRRLAPVSN